jgi:uncharacterized protein YprB with RNaseH-like and TPR domain
MNKSGRPVGKKTLKLTKNQKQRFIDLYSSSKPKSEVQRILSEELDMSERNVRNMAKSMNLYSVWQNTANDKILVYDIETSRLSADLWWTGKQYVNYKQVTKEPKIISISWKWIGEDKVYAATWDENQCDKLMLEKFLKYYNEASFVVGQNNNAFDNKWVKTRAAKHRLMVSRFVKSLDIYRLAKNNFRLISYSMDYMAHFFGLTPKQKHEGMIMWEMVENGTKKQQKEYLKKMVDYNKGDIVTTEELYLTLKPYFKAVTNKAVESGLPKWCCPVSGSKDVKLYKTLFTEMGTVQRILYCESSSHQYKVSNKVYMDYLDRGNPTKY